MIGFSVFFTTNADAMCVQNTDWPEAPCFDVFPVNRDAYRKAWAPYYDYKGQDWMETKKAEMYDASKNGKLANWMDKEMANFNVFSYYHSQGKISFPKEYDYFVFEDEMYLRQNGFLIIPMIAISGVIATLVYLWKKRK